MTGARITTHTISPLDVIGLLPYTLDGVPFAVNHGIVAHEHFHAHFQKQVINPLQIAEGIHVVSALENLFYGALDVASAGALNSADGAIEEPKYFNDIVMRGWNEGLADLYAALYTGQANFFTAAFPQSPNRVT